MADTRRCGPKRAKKKDAARMKKVTEESDANKLKYSGEQKDVATKKDGAEMDFYTNRARGTKSIKKMLTGLHMGKRLSKHR